MWRPRVELADTCCSPPRGDHRPPSQRRTTPLPVQSRTSSRPRLRPPAATWLKHNITPRTCHRGPAADGQAGLQVEDVLVLFEPLVYVAYLALQHDSKPLMNRTLNGLYQGDDVLCQGVPCVDDEIGVLW